MRASSHNLFVCVAVVGASLLTGISQAAADPVLPLPSVTVSVSNVTQNQTINDSTAPLTATVNSNGQFATATSNLQPSPNVTASASVNGGPSDSATAIARIIYSFFIEPLVGGQVGVEVPLFISAEGSVTPTSFGPNTALLWQGTPGNPTANRLGFACEAPDAACGSTPNSFSINTLLTLTSGVEWVIQMGLSVSALNGDVVSGYIDPILTIDPNWEFANDYQLFFSPGVGNSPLASPVPIPAALPLFAGGLGLLGWMARRRRSVHATLK